MKNNGFTLIELMVAVAVIGILAMIAMPNYTQFLQKSRRADGMTALLDLKQAQAKLRGNCRFYAQIMVNDNHDGTSDNNCAASAALTELEMGTTTPDGYYTLAISDGTASGNSYTATATAQGKQFDDVNCRTLILTIGPASPDGARTSTDSGGAPSTGCW